VRRLLATSSLAVVLAVAALTLVARPAGACACGIAFDAEVTAERALIQHDGDRQELILSLDLARPDDATGGSRPAVVLPVPATPRVTQVDEAQATLFDELDRATAPLPSSSGGDDDGAAPGAVGGGVDVISRRTLGAYDVSVLRSGDAGALRRWLDRHGYATPAEAEPVLGSYVRDDWAFVAIRLADGPEAGELSLRPLKVRFRSDELVYPLELSRVGTAPVSVRLYVAAGHRVVASGFDTFHAGTVAEIAGDLSPAVRDALKGGFLTRLEIRNRRPGAITGDVEPEQAPSDRAFRATTGYPFESADGFGTAPLPDEIDVEEDFDGPPVAAWLLLIPLVAGLMLGVRALLRRGGRTG